MMVCRTRAEAAKTAGVCEKTMREYLKDPEFQERYREAFGGIVEDAARQAQKKILSALDTLQEVMEDKQAQSYARVSAARSILDYALKLSAQYLGQADTVDTEDTAAFFAAAGL